MPLSAGAGADGIFIHRRIEQQAQRYPQAIAVIDAERQLSYATLNADADIVAARLAMLGIGPGDCVGVMLGRSCGLVTALLGVLKAGAAYVPLDPTYPLQRLKFMLHDTGTRLLISEYALAIRLDAEFDGTVLDLQQTLRGDVPAAELAAPRRLLPSHLAYVTYTSGSTGRPKAAGVQHANAAAFVDWALRVFTPDELASVLFATSVCFDLSIFELFVPLSIGGQVVVAANLLDLPALAERGRITLVNTVPSLMTELLRQHRLPHTVRTVNLAGEVLPQALVGRLYEHTHIERVFNLYGPSECTTYATFALMERHADAAHAPIGHPIAGTRCYVLDDRLQPVPDGEEGELYIGGDGVADGYIRRPALSAERFLPDPFADSIGRRMYRTGDRVKVGGDGQLLYAGRFDFQVKLHGYRIELGEIEAVLCEDPALEQAAVMLLGDDESRRLVAFVAPRGDAAMLQRETLRERLRQRLPDYMVPTGWVALDRLPTTLNGKLDRSALSQLPMDAPDSAPAFVPPRSETERTLASIWSGLLTVAEIGREDDFFLRGGHSLTAMCVLVRVQSECAVELALKDVFSAPVLKDLAAKIDSLAMEDPAASLPLDRLGATRAPLSYSQEMLYLENQLAQDALCYNVTESFHIVGELNVRALEWALTEVVRRHEVLRTRFVREDEEVVQRIDPPPATLSIPVFDLTGSTEADERREHARQWQIDSAKIPFALDKGPLLRATLLQCGPLNHWLVLTVHHIVTDGWSQSVLRRDISALYTRFDTASRLPELAVQYADYAVWQRRWLDQNRLQQSLEYWAHKLQGTVSPVSFPQDGAPAIVRSFHGCREPLTLPAALTAKLKERCAEFGVTPFNWLLTAFKVLLLRMTGVEDIVIGTAFSVRRKLETEALVGDLTNSVALRTELRGDLSFREALQRVAATTLDAHEHSDAPFQKVVERAATRREAYGNPFFRVMFVLENEPNDVLALGENLTVVREPIDIGVAVEDFCLTLCEENAGFVGFAEYRTDLYGRTTICRLLDTYVRILQESLLHTSCAIDALDLLGTADRAALLAWGQGARRTGQVELVVSRFSACARSAPDAIAVITDAGSFGYGELDGRSSQLAHYLRERGMVTEMRVGVLAERGVELCVALLALMKLGAVYVPLDPAYPIDRLRWIAADADMAAVLLHVPTRHLDLGDGRQRIDLDMLDEQLARFPTTEPVAQIDPYNLAYLVYTSGSSGKPKGVGITHAALANQIEWFRETFALTPADRFLQKTSISFDPSIEEIFGSLTAGASLIVARAQGEHDVDYLNALIEREGVTCIDLTPSLLDALMRSARPAAWQTVRAVWSGGEVLHPELVDAFHARHSALLYNTYGPTEATIQTTWTLATGHRGPLPIGRPIANTHCYVLDSQLALVPPGVRGELHIGGAALARGYYANPALTAEKFIPDPYGEPGSLMYRTGDQVRWRQDGQLEFFGRLDGQIKLRGFRIELGEIESALHRHPAVKQAAVAVCEVQTGIPALAAYVAVHEQYDLAGLREWLGERLPRYMVPVYWTTLDVLPVNANGKLDRAALPAPGEASIDSRDYVAPRNTIEAQICTSLAELLQWERIGVHDNFFDLGIHSLTAVRVVSRLEALFSIELPVRLIFEASTPAQLAAMVEERAGAGQTMRTEAAADDGKAHADRLLASLDTLSDEEVELLLEQLEQEGRVP
ncbi:non-ribosomal peptide synthetase [Rhodanobacter sp. C05]|uniref:non-ribosomal peptide synthetase n=1 Tax=Rhodanobacter sp. C05 TaxID=1945855 RepID=UPI0009CD64B4|nr:non-ribosomal peptide synthetase [Rhodanobacter sp. C05]OOG41448.1 hypothetical protein B0E51_07055 [Rhodanobacter sp. C05]